MFFYINVIKTWKLSKNIEIIVFSLGTQQILVPLSWESYQQAEEAYAPPGEHTKYCDGSIIK